MAIDIIGAVIDTLATHLEANVSGISNVLRSFPDPSQDTVYPSISISIAQPQATLRDPELVRQTEHDPDDGGVTAYYRIGSFDAPLQLDVWTRSATERGDTYGKLINALAYQVQSYGGGYPSYRNGSTLNLQLSNYYDFIASYSMRGLRWMDAEDTAEKREFRAIVNVTAAADIIVTREHPKMTLLDLDWRVGTGTLEQLANLPPEVQVIFKP